MLFAGNDYIVMFLFDEPEIIDICTYEEIFFKSDLALIDFELGYGVIWSSSLDWIRTQNEISELNLIYNIRTR